MSKFDPEFHEEQFHKKNKPAKRRRKDLKKKKIVHPLSENFENLKTGRVLSITGEKSIVDHLGKEYICSLRGILKREKGIYKNLITVGDFVKMQIHNAEGQIIFVEERKSELSRSDVTGRKKQLIAANVDQTFITMSVVAPPMKPSLLDRFIISAKKGKMHPILVINKIDLLDTCLPEEKKLYLHILEIYEKLGLTIVSVSSEKNKGIQNLKALMQEKSSVFIGQSGVGKSSLINATTEHNLRVGSLVQKTKKGAHTTTRAQLLPLQSGGFCIDTPGMKGFGLWDLQKNDVVDHFQEIKEIAKSCYFPNCVHLEEPKCAVKKALEKNQITELRFASYRSLIEETLNPK